MNKEELEYEINKEETLDWGSETKSEDTDLNEIDIIPLLKRAGGIDDHLEFVMRELEHCDDMIYNENLNASHFIYWQARKEALKEVRDNYCEMRK